MCVQVERRGEEVLPRTSWTAELSRLECFICYKGEGGRDGRPGGGQSSLTDLSCAAARGLVGWLADPSSGEVDLGTGVSLLNPVSCSLLFTSSYSLLRSPLRRVHLSLDQLLTMYAGPCPMIPYPGLRSGVFACGCLDPSLAHLSVLMWCVVLI